VLAQQLVMAPAKIIENKCIRTAATDLPDQ
jgi:hypothetical protein